MLTYMHHTFPSQYCTSLTLILEQKNLSQYDTDVDETSQINFTLEGHNTLPTSRHDLFSRYRGTTYQIFKGSLALGKNI